jgi:agmatinase
MEKIIENFIGCDSGYNEADIVLFGAPFDSTTSFRPGTRFASKEMRGNSYGLETYSPYQNKDMSEVKVFDGGDLELCIGSQHAALKELEEYADEIVSDGKIPFMIGGEHLVTLAPVRSVLKKYPDLHIIHFDAHTDLRDEYLGEHFSHATVLRRIWDITGDKRIHQFGIRSGDKPEFEWAKQHTDMHLFDFSGLCETIKNIGEKPVYFTIDLDVLDPSVFPGTGTPEAGGVTFKELLEAVIKTAKLNVVGCDVVELSPHYDQSGVSTMTACKIVRELILAIK